MVRRAGLQVRINLPAHPIAHGMSSSVTVSGPVQERMWCGSPAAGDVVASLVAAPNRTAILAMEPRHLLLSGIPPPARRVAFLGAAPEVFVRELRKLLTNAVLWTMDLLTGIVAVSEGRGQCILSISPWG